MEESIKETYRIQYVDNTYQLVEWTEEEFNDVTFHMIKGGHFATVNKCIYRLTDIRAIVYLPPVPEEEELPEENPIVITESGSFEKELYDTLVQNGYDLGTVLGQKEGN